MRAAAAAGRSPCPGLLRSARAIGAVLDKKKIMQRAEVTNGRNRRFAQCTQCLLLLEPCLPHALLCLLLQRRWAAAAAAGPTSTSLAQKEAAHRCATGRAPIVVEMLITAQQGRRALKGRQVGTGHHSRVAQSARALREQRERIRLALGARLCTGRAGL